MKRIRKKNIYVYNWIILLYSRKEHNIVNQLDLKKKKKNKEMLKKMLTSCPDGPNETQQGYRQFIIKTNPRPRQENRVREPERYLPNASIIHTGSLIYLHKISEIVSLWLKQFLILKCPINATCPGYISSCNSDFLEEKRPTCVLSLHAGWQ